MVISLKGVVGQLSVVEGVREQQADNILVIEPENTPALVRGRASLYALIELSGLIPPPPELRRDLLEIVRQEFTQPSGSVPATLQQAIMQVNQHLYDYNRESLRETRQGGGVTCMALRGTDLYIAQGGPAVAYVFQNGQLSRYPQASTWLDEGFEESPDQPPPRPLGASRKPRVDLFHCQLRTGDSVVLSESVLGQMASAAQIIDAMASKDVDLVAEYLADLVEGEDVSLAVIEAQAEEVGADEAVSEAEVSPPPQLIRRAPTERGQKGAQAARKPKKGQGFTLPLDRVKVDWRRMGESVTKGLSLILALLLRAVSFILGNARVLLVRTLPGSGEAGEETRRKVRPEKKPGLNIIDLAKQRGILKYVALAIPILIVIIAGLVYLEREGETRSKYSQLIQAAQAKHEKALAEMADVNQARSLLADALRLLDEAAAMSPTAPEPAQLKKEILDKVDQVNQVKRLYWIPELYKYTDSGTDLKRIVVDGINVYVLDRGTNRVLKHVLNETNDGFQATSDNPVILKQGDQIGDVVVKELLDMVWMPAGGGRQTSNLVIVDKKGALFDYSPTWGVKNRPLADTDKWLYPQVIGGFFGNLYVLDTQLNQIQKYVSTVANGGYANSPVSYLTDDKAKVDFSGAVDMAIDGHIYVIYANGRIAKFMGGVPVPFETTGLDVPLNNPAAIFANANEENQYLYVADTGNRRVVQLNKEGRFQRQFKVDTDAFDDLRGLWVDELENKMYVLSGNRAFAANLLGE